MRLLDGEHNLEVVIEAIAWWRKTCQLKTGTATETQVLQGYGGFSRPKLGQWCGTGLLALPKAVRWIRARRDQLVSALP